MRETLGDVARDLRFAARSLRRAPAFTVAAVSTLALGFAVVTITTAVVNAYLIRSLPYPHADRLYHVVYAPPGEREPGGMAALDWRALEPVVERVDYSAPTRVYIGEGIEREESLGLLVAPGSLAMLGVRAAYGRSLQDEDFRADAERVVMIGQSLWRERFGADPAIVGRTLRVSRASSAERVESFRIVGVLPDEFRYARAYDRGAMHFVLPLREPSTAYLVRLRSGVSPAYAEQVISAAVRAAATSLPPAWRGVRIESVHARYVEGVRPVLLAVGAAAVLVLIIVIVNLAVLMVLRALRRQKEVSIRYALGAGRAHVFRALASENVLVAGVAAVLAVVMSAVALRLLGPVIEERLGRSAPGGSAAIAIDGTVLTFVGVAGVLVAVLLSLIPLLSPWRGSIASITRRVGSGATDRAGTRVRAALVALELAVSLALLVGCGVMIRTVTNLLRTDLGYRAEHVMRARIALSSSTHPDASTYMRFYDQFAAHLAAQPLQFALTNAIPFYEYPQLAVETDDGTRPGIDAALVAVSEDYFSVLGITVLHGRSFTAADRANTEPVAIVSETLARRLSSQGNVIGRRMRAAELEDRQVAAAWRTIVGVTNDVRQTHTDVDLDDIYVPFAQAPARYAPIYVRTDQPPSEWLGMLRGAAAAIDPNVLITADVTGSSSLAHEEKRQLAARRFLTALLVAFAAFAALLATLGIFGVTGYAVQQRRRELAIRTAVGAVRRDLIVLFLKDCGVMLVYGLLLGLPAAVALGRALRHQLHGVAPLDPVTLLAAGALLASAALLASWWPAARRAAITNPAALLNAS